MLDDPSTQRIQFTTTLSADHIPAMIAYWDKDFICRFVNASCLEWFGHKSEAIVDIMTLEKLLGSLFERKSSLMQAVLRGEFQTFQMKMLLPTGEVRYSLFSCFPDIEEGEVKGFYNHLADVQEIKRFDKELLKSNEIMAEQNKQLKNFGNLVSHNLRSYSGNLDSLLQLLELAESENDRAITMNYLHDLSKHFSSTVSHLTQIVISQNQQDRAHKMCNILQFINDTVSLLKLQIDSSAAVILINADPKLNLFTNPAYLESILLNLITNAIKYKHPKRRPEIVIGVCEVEQFVVLEINDNGLGIDLKKHENSIFGMNNTFHGNTDAHGIGLYITKYQVDSLGGSIVVESKVDLGSTFRIFLKREPSN